MSSAYRYVVFAPGKQPTVEEVAELQSCVETWKCRYAVGINGENSGLALAFEARPFESACSTSGDFARLLSRWQVRGCEIRERLLFIKKPTALQPMPSSFLHDPVEHRSEPVLKRKQLAAQEALGRAGLKFHRTLEQHAWLHGVAKAVPYTLMALGGLLIILAGIYASQRLLDSPTERRQETVKRVADDAMGESLERQVE